MATIRGAGARPLQVVAILCMAIVAAFSTARADETQSAGGAAETPNSAPATNGGESAAKKSDVLRIHLMDGSQVGGKLGNQDVEIETPFGKLTIPVAAVVSLTPGLLSHPQIGKNINQLIEQLGSPVFAEREAAQKSLTALGPNIRPQIALAAEDSDTERRTRVKAILEEFDQFEQDEDADDAASPLRRLIDRDTIETTDFTVVGKIVPQEFEIVSAYGVLRVHLNDIRRIERAVAEKQDLQKAVVVDGSHLATRGKETWKDTGIHLNRGDKLTISADGQITLVPHGNQAISTPDGVPNYGFYVNNKIASGALIGRIGANGAMFRVGSKFTMVANRAGTLLLAVAFANDANNQVFPGEYKTRIKVKHK